MKMYFTKKLASTIADDYQNLLGQSIPTQLGELTIDKIAVVEVCNGEFDVVLFSDAENVKFREIYQVLNLTQFRLLDYLSLKGLEFAPRRYGALLGKFTSEKDENGIDLYL